MNTEEEFTEDAMITMSYIAVAFLMIMCFVIWKLI